MGRSLEQLDIDLNALAGEVGKLNDNVFYGVKNGPVATVSGDFIDADPALGVSCYEPVAALANAKRAGIDCHGNRHFGADQLTDRRAKTAEAVALAAVSGVPADLAEYSWMTNGFSLPETDQFGVSGPGKLKGQTLVGYIANEQTLSGGGGRPSGS